ncbi:MAG: class I SAM-dependent methyltransferase [Methanomassiliicoccales archaeon]|nr:class I SAM-dependent methyltransferase [Methanomassiliicoccales archaeon]
MAICDLRIEEYTKRRTTAPDPLFEDLRKETYAKTSNPGMQVGRVEGRFLRLLVELSGARTVLEFGTFTGYSALMMASGLGDGGVIYTLDRDEVTNAIARKYFARAPYGDKIRPIIGDARETMKRIMGPIDMAFIDADKTSYDAYYEEVVGRLLRPGGLVVLDNTLWGGSVTDPSDDDGKAIDAINRKIAKDPRVEAVLLTLRDGVTVARKK